MPKGKVLLYYHEPPDIKHNRRPAPDLSFTAPNLPTLMAEVAQLVPPSATSEDE